MKITSLSTLFLLVSFLFVSCLKTRDETGILEDNDGSTVVEITDVSYNNLYGSDQVIGMDPTPAQETVTAFTLKYQAGRKDPNADIVVKVTADGTGLPAGTIALPATNFTIPAQITIPRSADRTIAFPITINKTGLDFSKIYALTFKITEVSEGVISEIGKSITVQFTIKNKYDGIYQSKGYGFLGANTSSPYTFSTNCAWELQAITSGANSVRLDAQPLLIGGAVSYFSNVTPAFTFDPATNKVTGVTAAPGSIPMNFPYDATYDSRYDPATKTIYVKFGVNNNPAWYVIDTLIFCSAR